MEKFLDEYGIVKPEIDLENLTPEEKHQLNLERKRFLYKQARLKAVKQEQQEEEEEEDRQSARSSANTQRTAGKFMPLIGMGSGIATGYHFLQSGINQSNLARVSRNNARIQAGQKPIPDSGVSFLSHVSKYGGKLLGALKNPKVLATTALSATALGGAGYILRKHLKKKKEQEETDEP